MTAKRLVSGAIAYYWSPPTRARKAGCPVVPEALGTDYGAAKQRCDDILNPHYHSWLTKGEGQSGDAESALRGTFDWMVAVYKSSPKYKKLSDESRSSYDRMLQMVSGLPLKDGRRVGSLMLASITPGAADKLHERMKVHPKGGQRNRTALLAMRVCQRAWNVALRSEPKEVPSQNPFQKMDLEYKATPTRLFGHSDLQKFVAAADIVGERSIGTAAMIAFFWLQREIDILGRLSWSHYRPADNPQIARIVHHKTGEVVDLPLYDTDGSSLWPELVARLDGAERHGTLIVTRDAEDRWRKTRLPWKKRHFLRRVAEIRAAAGIDPAIKFMGLRHGGNTEGADACLTDAQMRALSGHRTTAALLRYAQTSIEQRRVGARLRRNARTKGGQTSE
ncbi:hypothetical protein [Bradyrhizobium sp. 6(2017)]|uniref:hypothetical protein n=1 Tax=Bradyrhizobium sp. 6(2017) TaxID=1197460 RepID=UPI0013E15453|nr:hypothetical protein [Bradyrhizobium sp. 6(2017)]QIG91988.1 hypothetical protein G6P99_05375 [Bradyrhizobium sp. 6(2017)]